MTGMRKRVTAGFLSIVCLLFFSGMVSFLELSRLSRDTDEILGANQRSIRLAREMLDAALASFQQATMAICAAAVADYTPAHPAEHKLKKGIEPLCSIELVPTEDILRTLSERKGSRTVVGFAAETDDVVANAQRKLSSKHADLIVGNEVGGGRAFGTDDNEVWFVTADDVRAVPRLSKDRLADEVLDDALKARG